MQKKPKNRLREWFDTLFYGIIIAVVFRSLFLEPFNIPSGSMIPTMLVGDHIFITKWSYGYSRYSFPFGSWKLWNGRVFKKMPKVGDVVVFRNPKNESLDYVKRVIGLPGDVIQMKNGRLYINGQIVERKDPRRYMVVALPHALRSEGYVFEDMLIKGNKITRNGAPVDFEYTIDYRDDEACRTTVGFCGFFSITKYTEVLPNGIEHPIIEYSDHSRMDNTTEYVVPENHLFLMGDNRDNSNDSRADVGFVPVDNVVGRVWFVWYSHNYVAPMVAFWKWGDKMRWNRFGKGIH